MRRKLHTKFGTAKNIKFSINKEKLIKWCENEYSNKKLDMEV